MPPKGYKIEKVPLDYLPVDHHPSFQPLPVLYLELIENKEKVVPELKNKTQDPIFLPNAENIHSYQPMNEQNAFNEKDIRSQLNQRMKKPEPPKKPPIEQDRKSVRERTLERQREEERVKELNRAREREHTKNLGRESFQSSPPPSYSSQPIQHSYSSPPVQHSYSSPPSYSSQPIQNITVNPNSSSYTQSSHSQPPPNEVIPKPNGTVEENAIFSVLGPSSNKENTYINSLPSVVPISAYTAVNSVQPSNSSLPPSLLDIQKGIPGPIKDMTYSSPADDVKRKRELLFRFDILKKSYKEANIPEFTEFTDIQTMENVYEDTVRKVGLDSKVEGYKKFLTMGFFGIEFLFTNLLKVDMTGFAKQQLASMNTYDRILIELGEKAMLDKTKSQWPAEIRLMFTILMNAVIFLLMKNVMSGGMTSMLGGIANAAVGNSGGGDMMSGIMSMMSGLGGSSSSGGSSVLPPPPKPKQKMKGPSVNLDG